MSWSFSAAGTPQEVSQALDTQNSGLTDQSKVEWEEAKPALKTLVDCNVGHNITINASGHASFQNGQKTYGETRVDLKSA